MAPKAKKRRTEVFANLKSFWQCCLFFCKESQLLHDSNWNGRWMKSSLLNVCFMHGYKSNTPFSVKWLSYTFLAPSYVGIQIVREINTCGCITQEGNGSQRFDKVVKPFLKEHYNFHDNFLQSSQIQYLFHECPTKIQLHWNKNAHSKRISPYCGFLEAGQ